MKIHELRATLAERFGRDYMPKLDLKQGKKKSKSRPKPKPKKKGY